MAWTCDSYHTHTVQKDFKCDIVINTKHAVNKEQEVVPSVQLRA